MKEKEVKPKVLKLKGVEIFKKLPNPYDKDSKDKPMSFEILVDIKNLPENFNMATNPRNQNMRTGVVRKIKESLLLDDESFYLKNRGILLSADRVFYDNVTKEVTITFSDDDLHGCVDGGHTFKAIQSVLNEGGIEHKHFVKIEVMTGIEDIFHTVAEARNTSVNVKDSSIAELNSQFKFIKDIIKTESFANNIEYKDNEEDKEIDIAYIISLLYMFNIDRFNSPDVAPIQASSSINTCMKDFLNMCKEYKNDEDNNPYYKQKEILIDIFRLHDMLQARIGEYYKESTSNGKYGSIKGITTADPKKGKYIYSTFYKNEIKHGTPKGLLLPILGSLRALLIEENGVYKWRRDPYEYLDKLGKYLVVDTIDRHRSLGNAPASVGKDSAHWKALYARVYTEYMDEVLAEIGIQ
jgi:hypothetical protein